MIPEGVVDDRSIEDVQPKDLKEFKQCHFFAGIGGWAYALQLARWDSDRPVWTGSCPCQSFSAAGQRKGADDERNLWPQWFRLIRESRPATVFGEQVIGAIGFGWLDAVATDLEACDYRFASSVLSGYTVGAYHRRQRLWFVADTTNDGRSKRQSNKESRRTQPSCEERRLFEFERERSHMADTEDSRRDRGSSQIKQKGKTSERHHRDRVRSKPQGQRSHMADSEHDGSFTVEVGRGPRETRNNSSQGEDESSKPEGASGSRIYEEMERSHMADTVNEGLQGGLPGRSNEERTDLNGYIGHNSSVDWRAVEWVECGDGKTRPIPLESDVQPLVNGVPEVMDSEGNPRKYSYSGSLKGIGNAIIPQVAAEFISAYMEVK